MARSSPRRISRVISSSAMPITETSAISAFSVRMVVRSPRSVTRDRSVIRSSARVAKASVVSRLTAPENLARFVTRTAAGRPVTVINSPASMLASSFSSREITSMSA